MRRHLTYANVMATLAFAIAVAGGTAYAANTVFSSDIVDGEVKSADIGTGQVRTADIGNDQVYSADVRDKTLAGGGLSGADIRSDSLTGLQIINGSISSPDLEDGSIGFDQLGVETQFVDFTATIGTVVHDSCSNLAITGIDAAGDHLLLTPSWADSDSRLVYSARYRADGNATLSVCNHGAGNIDDGTTHFNLFVIDAQ
jgi:hypothetical protein